MKNADMPAMPTPVMDNHQTPHGTEPTYGLTKREMFAMAAMNGILSRTGSPDRHIVAGYAVDYADALLKELDK